MSSPIPAVVAAKIARTDRELVSELREAGAITAASAVALRRTPLRSRRITRLASSGVLNGAAQDRFFLNEDAWNRYQTRRRVRLAIVFGIFVTVIALGLAFGFFRS